MIRNLISQFFFQLYSCVLLFSSLLGPRSFEGQGNVMSRSHIKLKLNKILFSTALNVFVIYVSQGCYWNIWNDGYAMWWWAENYVCSDSKWSCYDDFYSGQALLVSMQPMALVMSYSGLLVLSAYLVFLQTKWNERQRNQQ